MLVSENHAYFGSDHQPISINIHNISSYIVARNPKRYYFEQKWMLEDDFADCVEQGWSESVLLLNLPDQLSAFSHV